MLLLRADSTSAAALGDSNAHPSKAMDQFIHVQSMLGTGLTKIKGAFVFTRVVSREALPVASGHSETWRLLGALVPLVVCSRVQMKPAHA